MPKKPTYNWPKPPACQSPPHAWDLDEQSVGACRWCGLTWDFKPPAGAYDWKLIVPTTSGGLE